MWNRWVSDGRSVGLLGPKVASQPLKAALQDVYIVEADVTQRCADGCGPGARLAEYDHRLVRRDERQIFLSEYLVSGDGKAARQ